MGTKISELLATATPRTVAVVGGISDDQLDLGTPCADFSVRGLLNHLFEVVVNFQTLARKGAIEWSGKPDFLTDGWRERFAVETDRLVEAWSDPAALDGVSVGMGMPQETIGYMVLLDLTVHAWDLARATGQPFEADPAALPELHELLGQLAPQGRQMGHFGELVTVPADAPELDRLLGLAGRDPDWSPSVVV